MTRTNSTLRRLRWPSLALLSVAAAAGWWRWPADETTARDRTPLAAAFVPPENATPVLRSCGPLAASDADGFAKPVVAADRDGLVVVAAMKLGSGVSELVRWRSTDGGRAWGTPTPFDAFPTGRDFAFDPWLHTDHRGRLHLVHAATSLKKRDASPCVYRRSLDGGVTWQPPARVAESFDRPVLGVSPNGERLVIVGMGCDPGAAPLTSADVTPDGAIAFDALERVMAAGVFVSNDRGRNWERVLGPPGVRSAVAFGTVIDDAGRVATVWVVNDNRGSRSLVGTTADGGTTWSTTVLVQALQPDRQHPFNGGRFPVVALDGAGRLHAVYVEAGGKAVATRVSRDWVNWSEPTRLTAGAETEVRFAATAAAGDVVHAAWMERVGGGYQTCYRGSRDGGANWSAPLTLNRPSGASSLVTPAGFAVTSDDDQMALADDGSGTAHVVWAVKGKPPATSGAVWHATIGWSSPGH